MQISAQPATIPRQNICDGAPHQRTDRRQQTDASDSIYYSFAQGRQRQPGSRRESARLETDGSGRYNRANYTLPEAAATGTYFSTIII